MLKPLLKCVWLYTSVIPAPKRPKQDRALKASLDYRVIFEASLSYIMSHPTLFHPPPQNKHFRKKFTMDLSLQTWFIVSWKLTRSCSSLNCLQFTPKTWFLVSEEATYPGFCVGECRNTAFLTKQLKVFQKYVFSQMNSFMLAGRLVWLNSMVFEMFNY